jgi:octaprenyl-diphosphate synthase
MLKKHRALEDTVERARHYGAIAKDALAIFPDLRTASRRCSDVVDFCVARAH